MIFVIIATGLNAGSRSGSECVGCVARTFLSAAFALDFHGKVGKLTANSG
jgi:hypothetical protein